MRRFLLDLGVPDAILELETVSENTATNASATAALLAQLQEKFRPDTVDAYRERITAAKPEQLLQWSKRILSAETSETILH